MKLDTFSGQAFRALTPRWSHAPTSGAGAALEGGRFNRPGIHALYLALDWQTAVEEFQQTAALLGFRPTTITAYTLVAIPVADFRHGYASGWDALWADWDCEWKDLAFRKGIDPPTWDMSDAVLASGAKGLLFPSTKRPGGINLVVFTELLDPASMSLEVSDPDGSLPVDQTSWPKTR